MHHDMTGFAVPIQLSLPTGSYVMEPAEHREPYEPRGSRTVLGAPGGEIPPGDSTEAANGPDHLTPDSPPAPDIEATTHGRAGTASTTEIAEVLNQVTSCTRNNRFQRHFRPPKYGLMPS